MTITVPATPTGSLGHAWRECVGTGRANLSLRHDFVVSAALAHDVIGFRHIRGHGLFSDDMGVLRESGGVRRYGFTYLDQVCDTYLGAGMRPVLELGFTPGLLASGTQTVFWWKGNITPPRDLGEWTGLVTAALRHLIARYGAAEVRGWPVEVWNEPNLATFWDADQATYFRLYDATARAVKAVDAALTVGGPATAPDAPEWVRAFGEHVLADDVPCDIITTHAYASGPAQHIPFGVYQTLRPPSHLLEQFALPRGLYAGTPLAGLPHWVTEFNTSYRPDNPIHDTAYNACYLAPVLAGGGAAADAFSYWTLCDVFEEENIPTALFHGGFGLLARHQLRKPTWHLYAFMARLGDEVLARGEDHLVTRHADGRLGLLAWQPLGGSAEGPYGSAPASHRLRLRLPVGACPRAAIVRHRVNEHAGNAWTLWRELGRPASPDSRTMELLYDAAEPAVEHRAADVDADGTLLLDLTLERHEITLVEVVPVVPTHHEGLDDTRLLGHEPSDDEGRR
ncbi:MAG: xylan 1,4-beta-xylosidase [Actinomycetia bacterium]|nr:xylan 1,4-beta-xylosidase [Actinomycetes bacterium]